MATKQEIEAEVFHLLHKAIGIINEKRFIEKLEVLDGEISKAVRVLLDEDKDSFDMIGSNV